MSTTKDRMGKSRLEEKIIKIDLIPLKESLTEKPPLNCSITHALEIGVCN